MEGDSVECLFPFVKLYAFYILVNFFAKCLFFVEDILCGYL